MANLHSLDPNDTFIDKAIGCNSKERKEMLQLCKVESTQQLIQQTLPKNILFREKQNSFEWRALTESEMLSHMQSLASQNKVFENYIGNGYYGTLIPPVIQRNVLESPGWYTPYTPYQAEISQGRMEGLLVYQTMVSELTGMEVSNASLLDEASAAAEGMFMSYSVHNGKRRSFFIDSNVFT